MRKVVFFFVFFLNVIYSCQFGGKLIVILEGQVVIYFWDCGNVGIILNLVNIDLCEGEVEVVFFCFEFFLGMRFF